MAAHLTDIIERDGLPHLAHVLNGWGNARFHGHHLMEALLPFVHRDQAGRPIILQCDMEGEFHPWQSFAYAVMAGVDPDQPVPPLGVSLRTLAQNSRSLDTREGRELGHLLFALAYLDPDIASQPFSLQGDICDIPTLMAMAVEAHHYGTFEVCRKFHLTEGLCVMAARVAGLEHYRTDAQGFLDGQLDMLLLLGLILEEAKTLTATQRCPQSDSLIQEIRNTLVLGNYLENHCYYAGHIIELAAFAASVGYRVAPEHTSAMAFVLNQLNATLLAALPRVSFLDCFLHLGHYRRAMTLLLALERAETEGRALTRADLARYTVDFDTWSPSTLPRLVDSGPLPPVQLGVYDLAAPSSHPRAAFEEVIAHYAAIAPPTLTARGRFDHFRRIGPPSWPRAFHYELLDYGGAVGVEIHLESDAVRPLAEPVRALTTRVAPRFRAQRVEWDATWWRHRGRLRIIFGSGTSPARIAAGMRLLIELTLPDLDTAASRLRIASAADI
jgi:hypothetical protein